MNRALVGKFVGDSRLPLSCVVVGIVGYAVLFVWAMQNLGAQLLEFLSSVQFLRQMLEMAYGIDLSGEVSSTILYAIAFSHPVVLALSWGMLITACTRVIAAEIDWGTADLVLSLPVSRPNVYASSVLDSLFCAVIVSFCPLLGVWIGIHLFEPTEPVILSRFIAPSVNFLALNLAIAGITMLAASFTGRRAHAVAIVIGVALVCITMKFLEPFLPWLERIQFISPLNYYNPAESVRNATWPTSHIIALTAIGLATALIGLWQFRRKDIPAA